MMKRVILLTTLLLLGAMLVGCMHTRYRPRSGRPVSMTSNLGTAAVPRPVGTVDETYRRKWLLFWIVPIGKDGGDMIDDALGGAQGMINCRIKAEWTFLDLVITGITFGIFCTRSVEIKGTLVAYDGAPPPPAGSAVTTPPTTPSTLTGNLAICRFCGRASPKTAAFCQHCGKPLLAPDQCPKCLHQNHAGAKFCAKCGTKMPEK